MNLKWILVIVAVVALGLLGGAYLGNRNDSAMEKKTNTMIEEKTEDAAMIEKKSGDEAMMEKKEGAMTYQGDRLSTSGAPLLDFNQADYAAAISSDKLIALYFYANWCPICKAEFPKMVSVFNSLQDENIIGFRVNYKDDATDADEVALAKQFGVAYQHTKVFVRGGSQVLKSPEGWDKARYQLEINKSLSN